jgi:hypothetical protein
VLVGVEAPTVSQPADRPPLGPISPRTWPLSRSPRSYPRLTAAQRAGELPSATAVTAWRNQASRLPAQPATPSPAGDADYRARPGKRPAQLPHVGLAER